MRYVRNYLLTVAKIARRIDGNQIRRMVSIIERVAKGRGRLFILGIGGGAANAGHAVNDFRKIAGIEAYAPTDNVSELTARANDDGWERIFAAWLEGSRLCEKDAVLVFSVGGGNLEKNISVNIVEALKFAKSRGAKILGVVGRDGGFTAKIADACIIVPVIDPDAVTPHTESFQSTVWHLIVSHPVLRRTEMKWESED